MGRGQAEVKLMGALDDILLGTAAAAAKRTVLAVVTLYSIFMIRVQYCSDCTSIR